MTHTINFNLTDVQLYAIHHWYHPSDAPGIKADPSEVEKVLAFGGLHRVHELEAHYDNWRAMREFRV